MGVDIEEIDTRTAPESLLRELHEYYIPMYAEELPDDPPIPFDRQAADWRNIRESERVPRWTLRLDGEIAAVGVALMELEHNLVNGYARIHVKPEHRGKGLARMLATPILDLLESDGRRRLSTYVKEGSPEEPLLEQMGLKRAYRERRSRLVVCKVDMTLMRLWIARAPERASDYDLLFLQPPFPEDVIEKYCDLQFQLNTAPMEGYEQDDEVITPKMWRDIEEKTKAAQTVLNTYIAVHLPTGAFVGSTTVQTDLLHPHQGWQWETVVHPDHRNKGLGRWLKAAMIERMAAEHPELAHIDTWNAGSNQPMLSINVAMGFKPILVTHTWQGNLFTARERLGV